MRLLLVGHGRLARAIESLCPARGVEIAGVLDEENNAGGRALDKSGWPNVDVAVDASTGPAFIGNYPKLVGLGINLVVGTTGWQSHEAAVRQAVAQAGIGIVVAPNFSIGAALLEDLATRAVRVLAAHPEYGAWIHEAHHAAKQDAPSGTALRLQRMMTEAGYNRAVDMSSTRAGFIPGTHTVGFDGHFETITLTHTVRDRAVFAEGALTAAAWVQGKTGWFSMRDVLGLQGGAR